MYVKQHFAVTTSNSELVYVNEVGQTLFFDGSRHADLVCLIGT
jgi:hypothetical protein